MQIGKNEGIFELYTINRKTNVLMIVEFSMGNYRSFNKMQTLSFKATGLVSEDKAVDEKNIVAINGTNYLKIAGIYGANGSGKSNALEGLLFFSQMIISSLIFDDLAEYTMNPFRFSEEIQADNGFFQIVLILKGNKYRYGFSINRLGNIQSEWLFGPAERNETFYFKRTSESVDIEVNKDYFKEGYDLPKDKLKDNGLFLTFCASYDGLVANAIREYFRMNVTIEGLTRYPVYFNTKLDKNYERDTDLLITQGRKDLVLTWLKEAGMCYEDIEIDEVKNERKRNRVYLFKNTYKADGTVAGTNRLDLDRDESEGSKKYYNYIGKLLRKFNEGGLFVADEIDNNFHPSLLKKLISLFQDPKVNKAGAQLLFTSHDTNLMSPDYMRRDQFYFAEKTLLEDTKLYSLSDLKGIRNNADFARQYLSGAYGAVPVLGNYLEEQEN